MINRRQFSIAVSAAPWAAAWANPFRDGVDYQTLKKPIPMTSPAGVTEIHEFFSYTCIHCYRMEADFQAWRKKLPAGKFVVQQVPVRFNAAFEPLQKTFYALEAMKKLEQVHTEIFYALHVERTTFTLRDAGNLEAITRWLVSQGINEKEFLAAVNSPAVAAKVARANELTDRYMIEGTPAIGIAGKYLVPGQGAKTMQVANALLGLK